MDWTALLSEDPRGEPSVYYNFKTRAALTPLLSSVPYLLHPAIDGLTASLLVHGFFMLLSTPNRLIGALKNFANIESIGISEASLPNSSDSPHSLGSSVAATLSISVHQRLQSSLAPPSIALAAVSCVGTPPPFTVVECFASTVAPRPVRMPPTLEPPSDPNYTGEALVVSLIFGSETTRVLPLHLRLLVPPEAMAATGAINSGQLATIKY